MSHIQIKACDLCNGVQREHRCPRCWGCGAVPAGFLPSDVVLRVPPLTDTMRKTEVECAAALLVATLALRGDEWRPVRWTEAQEVLLAHRGERPEGPAERAPHFLWHVQRNPFMRPDFGGLIAGGFATRGADEAITLSPEGIAALAKWVRIPEPGASSSSEVQS